MSAPKCLHVVAAGVKHPSPEGRLGKRMVTRCSGGRSSPMRACAASRPSGGPAATWTCTMRWCATQPRRDEHGIRLYFMRPGGGRSRTASSRASTASCATSASTSVTFATLTEAQQQIEAWRVECDAERAAPRARPNAHWLSSRPCSPPKEAGASHDLPMLIGLTSIETSKAKSVLSVAFSGVYMRLPRSSSTRRAPVWLCGPLARESAL